jgi:hypothetical protein
MARTVGGEDRRLDPCLASGEGGLAATGAGGRRGSGWERSDLGAPVGRSWRLEVGREGRERIGKKNLTLYHVGNPNPNQG